MKMDKITPLAAPPGHSLTGEPGRWPWEQPPRYTDPNEVIDHVVNRLESSGDKDDLIKMMLAGVTVEELVSQISFKGFMAGAFTPDVAELIKPALAIYLVGAAEEAGVDAELFLNKPEDKESDLTDRRLFEIMKQRNPILYADMIEEMNKTQRMGSRPQATEQPPVQPSFLNSEGE